MEGSLVSILFESVSELQLPIWAHLHSGEGPLIATNAEGIPMPSLTDSLGVGLRGPLLLEDGFLLETLASFNRERIPERPVHAKGAGAFGVFQLKEDMSRFTKAKLFNGVGKQTNVSVRFSQGVGESGSADTAFDLKGFAVKFYTEEGNYDLAGLSSDAFALRDPILFSDLNRSRKRNPATHLHDYNSFWDFINLRPETALHALHLFSDESRPSSYRVMDGFSIHAFKWVAASGAEVFVKYRWKALAPWSYLTVEESTRLAGINADYLLQDLYDSIGTGEFPAWDLQIQMQTPEQIRAFPGNPFDATKPWRKEDIPWRTVGRMTLNRNPKDYFSEVEQMAFSPGNLVPGVEPSPDRLLQGRIFAYPDAQRYRIGVNFPQLEVNKAVSPVHSYERDGRMCYGRNGDGGPNYYPNSFEKVGPGVGERPFKVDGLAARYVDRADEDNFRHCRLYLEKDLDKGERERLVSYMASHLVKADERLQEYFFDNVARNISKVFEGEIKGAVEMEKRKTKMDS